MSLFQITSVPSGSTIFPAGAAGGPVLIGRFVSRFLVFAVPLAGMYFFVKFTLAAFKYMTSQGDPAKIQMATKEITTALTGLLLVVSSYFIAQIMEVITGINIV